jgi:hypothetical protein
MRICGLSCKHALYSAVCVGTRPIVIDGGLSPSRCQDEGITGASKKGLVALAANLRAMDDRLRRVESADVASGSGFLTPPRDGGSEWSASVRSPAPSRSPGKSGDRGAKGSDVHVQQLQARVSTLEDMLKNEVLARIQGEASLSDAIAAAQQVCVYVCMYMHVCMWMCVSGREGGREAW